MAFPKSQNSTVQVRQRSHKLKDICGDIKLVGAPHYSLVLDTGSDVFPLTLIDSARHLTHWISAVGQRVIVNQLLAVSEDLQISNENHSVEHQSFMAKWENVKILEERKNYQQRDNEDLQTKGNIKINRRTEAEHIIKSQSACQILVHHVSTPFHVDESTSGTCLVLTSYSNRNHIETKLWLVLRGEQVAWREFLIPNREYFFQFPSEIDRYFFDKSQKPLDTVMGQNIRELRVMFHHKTLFSNRNVLNGSIVPPGSKLFLSSNTGISELVYRFTSESLWFRFWFSTSEADHASAPLVTFYGNVSAILYLEEDVYMSCYLCIQKNPREPQQNIPKSTVSQVWMDPFRSNLMFGETELIELPSVTNDGNTRMKTGVPGKLVQVIKLQDTVTGEERSVYIKHSYVSNCQQMMRLAPGMCVCITHLNRRCSSAGKYYYITTMLSCCRALDYLDDNRGNNEGWGLYGLCQMTNDPHVKTWGVLEPFNVSKVAIRAKCDYCGALLFEGKCSNYCAGPGTHTPSAYAIAWVNIIDHNKTITMEKVLIKDGLVQKLLGVPEKMWMLLVEAAAQEEIVVFRDQALNESSSSNHLRKMFQLYFSVKTREKFYISLKKLQRQDEGDLYYCVNLEPISQQRLNTVAELVVKTTKV